MKSDITEREYGVIELLSLAWQLFKENFMIFLPILLLIYLPLNVVHSFVVSFVIPLITSDTLQAIRLSGNVWSTLELFFGVVAVMAMAIVLDRKMEGKEISWKDALVESLRKWFALLATNILTGIALLLLTLAFIIPGILYYVYWYFLVYVVATRGKWGWDAWSYSEALVKKRWWKTFGWIFLVGILGVLAAIPFLIADVGVNLVLVLVLGKTMISDAVASGFSILISTATSVVLAYFTVVTFLLFYNYDKVRRFKEAPKQVVASKADVEPVKQQPPVAPLAKPPAAVVKPVAKVVPKAPVKKPAKKK
ncbi:MAG: hypothetical protein V1492_05655 [Candidatus Micrarchaeota archaeon]